GEQLVRRRLAVTHPPRGLGFPEQDRTLGVGHDTTAAQLAKSIPLAFLINPRAELAALQEFQGFNLRILASHPQVTPKQPVSPSTLLTLIRHEADADLSDREGERIVYSTRAIARLDATVEQNVHLRRLELVNGGLEDPCPFRSVAARSDHGKHALAERLDS